MRTFKAVLILFAVIMSPIALGLIGNRIGESITSDPAASGLAILGFGLGCIPLFILLRSRTRPAPPADDPAEEAHWLAGQSGNRAERDEDGGAYEGSWEGGSMGGDSGGD